MQRASHYVMAPAALHGGVAHFFACRMTFDPPMLWKAIVSVVTVLNHRDLLYVFIVGGTLDSFFVWYVCV